jgi:ABC-type uncharacterized transport system permease subunit
MRYPRLEVRSEPSAFWEWMSPLLALAITVLVGTVLFWAMGKAPERALLVFFWEPIKSSYALGELMVKATPLLLISLGLGLSFRANVWNIGAEGQYVMGAIFASGVALHVGPTWGPGVGVLVLLAGLLGGLFWAGIVAVLRERFHANEILVSLMLVYVATMILSYLVYGPWRDPDGYNFPQTKIFDPSTRVPLIFHGSRMTWGLPLALLGGVMSWLFLYRTRVGFGLQVSGMAPLAARLSGFSSSQHVYLALLVSGACAGLAGALEVSGPIGQLTPYMPVGYGFAAIIVAFVGRLHPLGMVLSAILMSMFYIGGELAQSRLGLPKSLTGVFQGLLLFSLLICDTLIYQRLTWPSRLLAQPVHPEEH